MKVISLSLWWLQINPYGYSVLSKMGGKEPAFDTLFLPEYISEQAVDLLSRILKGFMSVFKGRYKFNRNNRNGEGHVKIFPAGVNPVRVPRKTTFHDRIKRCPFRGKSGVAGKSLVRIKAQIQTQIYILISGRNLLLSPIFYQQNLLSCFCKITCLRIERVNCSKKDFSLRSYSYLPLKEKQITKKNNISTTVLLWVIQNLRKKSRLKMIRYELVQKSLILTNLQSLATNLFKSAL